SFRRELAVLPAREQAEKERPSSVPSLSHVFETENANVLGGMHHSEYKKRSAQRSACQVTSAAPGHFGPCQCGSCDRAPTGWINTLGSGIVRAVSAQTRDRRGVPNAARIYCWTRSELGEFDLSVRYALRGVPFQP